MEEANDTPKISKSEEKESFLKRLESQTDENRKILSQIQEERERIEEIASRNLLGGKSDSVSEQSAPVEETAKEYAHRMEKGQLKPGEFK